MITASLRIYTPAGARLDTVTDYSGLAIVRQVNAPGMSVFTLPGTHRVIDALEDKSQIECWWGDDENGIGYHREFVGLYRQPTRKGATPGEFKGICPGSMSLLGRRIVNWKAETSSRSTFSSARSDTIMRTIVDYNCCANAITANGRLRAGVITGLTAAAVSGVGVVRDWSCAYDNVLETLQKLAPISGGDFDVVKTGAASFEWQWFAGQMGTDRSATVRFSLERGNMGDPVYAYYNLTEKTVATVGGGGEGSDRSIQIETGTNYSATNDIEMFVDARGAQSANELIAKGQAALAAVEAYDEFSFDVIQTPSSLYGKHYFLGDLAMAVNPFTGTARTVKIEKIGMTFAGDNRAGETQVKVEVRNV